MFSYYVSLRSDFRVVMSVTISKNDVRFVFTSSCVYEDPCPIYGYLCLFVNSGVQHYIAVVFFRVVYLILPDILDCPFLIAPLVFSNVYCESSQEWYHVRFFSVWYV